MAVAQVRTSVIAPAERRFDVAVSRIDGHACKKRGKKWGQYCAGSLTRKEVPERVNRQLNGCLPAKGCYGWGRGVIPLFLTVYFTVN